MDNVNDKDTINTLTNNEELVEEIIEEDEMTVEDL